MLGCVEVDEREEKEGEKMDTNRCEIKSRYPKGIVGWLEIT